jgi:hypothetical protein
MTSWRGAQLKEKHRDNFTFTWIHILCSTHNAYIPEFSIVWELFNYIFLLNQFQNGCASVTLVST